MKLQGTIYTPCWMILAIVPDIALKGVGGLPEGNSGSDIKKNIYIYIFPLKFAEILCIALHSSSDKGKQIKKKKKKKLSIFN